MKTIFKTNLLSLALLCSSVTPAALGMDEELRRAVQQEDVPRLRELLATPGADINATNQDGKTLLHIAAGMEKNNSIQVLLEAGACTSIRDNNGNTPLHLAAIGNEWWSDLNEDGIRLMQRMMPAIADTTIGDFQKAHDAIAAIMNPIIQLMTNGLHSLPDTIAELLNSEHDELLIAIHRIKQVTVRQYPEYAQWVCDEGCHILKLTRRFLEEQSLVKLLPERQRQHLNRLPQFVVNRITRPLKQLRELLLQLTHTLEQLLLQMAHGNDPEQLVSLAEDALRAISHAINTLRDHLHHVPALTQQLMQEHVLDNLTKYIEILKQEQQTLPDGPQALAEGTLQQLVDLLSNNNKQLLQEIQQIQQHSQPPAEMVAVLPADTEDPILQAMQAILSVMKTDLKPSALMIAWLTHYILAPSSVQLLLDAGAEPDIPNHNGCWPEKIAEQFEFHRLAQQLRHARQSRRQRETGALYCALILRQHHTNELIGAATLAGYVAEFAGNDNPEDTLLKIDAQIIKRDRLEQMNPLRRQLILLQRRTTDLLQRKWQQTLRRFRRK